MATLTCPGLEYRGGTEHKYFYRGVQRPGITRVLRDLGYYGSGAQFYTDESRIRGTSVHEAARLVDVYHPDATDIDEIACSQKISIPEIIFPYVSGYLLFRRESKYKALAHEVPMFSQSLLLCGTPDSLGRQAKAKIVVDLKTWKGQGIKPKVSSVLQAAGYQIMTGEVTGQEPDERWILMLSGNSKYRIFLCDDPTDREMITYASRIWWHQKNNKLISLAGDEPELEGDED